MNDLQLFVHEDITLAARWYNIPIALYNENSVYILQGSRCVYVGSVAGAERFYNMNNGKYCATRFETNNTL
jgi:hypothetical protein